MTRCGGTREGEVRPPNHWLLAWVTGTEVGVQEKDCWGEVEVLNSVLDKLSWGAWGQPQGRMQQVGGPCRPKGECSRTWRLADRP